MPPADAPGRAAKIRALIAGQAGGRVVTPAHLCRAAVEATGCDGAALWLATSTDRRALIHATDELSSYLDDWQFTVGEGPCLQAWNGDGPALVADLEARGAADRWPVYASGALEAGARAVFALPVQMGAIRLGVLDLYRRTPGSLTEHQFSDALGFAVAALSVLLALAHPETLGMDGADGAWPVDGLGAGRVEVYQATGMVAVQLGVGLAEALTRLRAHAYTSGVPLGEIARRVVARRLRFSPDHVD